MHLSKTICLLCIALSLGCLSAPSSRPFFYGQQATPDGYPLEIDMSQCNVGALLDRQSKKITVPVKNITDKPVVLSRVMVNCPCLNLLARYDDSTIQPQGTLNIDVQVDASLLHEVEFSRRLILAPEGYAQTVVQIKGYLNTCIEVKPAVCIYLGRFTGLVPWKRVFTIKSKLQLNKVSISPQPAKSDRFTLEFEKKSDSEYQVTVMSKVPMAIGKFTETFLMNVQGIENYAPIELTVMGQSTGIDFYVTPKKSEIYLGNLRSGEATEATATVMLAANYPEAPKLYSDNLRAGMVYMEGRAVYLPASKEDSKVYPVDEPETWEKYCKDLTYKLPEGTKGVTLEFKPNISFADVVIHATKEFLASPNSDFLPISLYWKERLIGKVSIIGIF